MPVFLVLLQRSCKQFDYYQRNLDYKIYQKQIVVVVVVVASVAVVVLCCKNFC